jgi:prevent-host-death family protein
MRNHSGTATGPRVTKATVGVRELKTHAGRILRRVREARASYILTHRGHAVGVILPIDGSDVAQRPDDHGAAWNAFLRAGRRLERRFRPDVSGVRLLSSTRR